MKKLILALVLAPSLAFADGFFGGGAGGGGSGTVSSGTTNTLSKYTAATTVGNSAITDDGSGAIGIYPASATPQAVTETFASGSGANIAGANTTIKLSGSTGSGVGGTLAIQNTNLAGAGSTANTYGNVLTLSPPNTGTTAPVNYIDIKNAITTAKPTITATGSDAGVDMAFVVKGNSPAFTFSDTAGHNNSVSIVPGSSIRGAASIELGTAGARWADVWAGQSNWDHAYHAIMGTITSNLQMFDGTATWNDAGTTFFGIKTNVTNTASAAASRLLDLQVGSASKFAVDTAGVLYSATAAGTSHTYNVRAAGGTGDCTIITTGGLVTGGTC